MLFFSFLFATGACGVVSRAPRSLFDIPHTICDLAGINVKGDGTGVMGITFSRQAAGRHQEEV